MTTPYHVIYLDNDNLIEFSAGNYLTDAEDGTAVTGATVTAQLAEADGTPVGSSITMSAVAGEDGNYRGTIPDDLDLSAYTELGELFAEVTAVAPGGATAFWRLNVLPENRD